MELTTKNNNRILPISKAEFRLKVIVVANSAIFFSYIMARTS